MRLAEVLLLVLGRDEGAAEVLRCVVEKAHDGEGYLRASALNALCNTSVHALSVAVQSVLIASCQKTMHAQDVGKEGWGGLVERGLRDGDAFVRRAAVRLLDMCLWGDRGEVKRSQGGDERWDGSSGASGGTRPCQGVVDGIEGGRVWRDLVAKLAVDVDWEVGVRTLDMIQGFALGRRGDRQADWGVDSGGEGGATSNGIGRAACLGRVGVEEEDAILSVCCAGPDLFWDLGGGDVLLAGMKSSDKPVRMLACRVVLKLVSPRALCTYIFCNVMAGRCHACARDGLGPACEDACLQGCHAAGSEVAYKFWRGTFCLSVGELFTLRLIYEAMTILARLGISSASRAVSKVR